MINCEDDFEEYYIKLPKCLSRKRWHKLLSKINELGKLNLGNSGYLKYVDNYGHKEGVEDGHIYVTLNKGGFFGNWNDLKVIKNKERVSLNKFLNNILDDKIQDNKSPKKFLNGLEAMVWLIKNPMKEIRFKYGNTKTSGTGDNVLHGLRYNKKGHFEQMSYDKKSKYVKGWGWIGTSYMFYSTSILDKWRDIQIHENKITTLKKAIKKGLVFRFLKDELSKFIIDPKKKTDVEIVTHNCY